MAMFGIGADSRLFAPMKVMAVAMKPSARINGNACSPAQYVAIGVATQEMIPMIVAGR